MDEAGAGLEVRVFLRRTETGVLVEARLRRSLTAEDARTVDAQWRPYLEALPFAVRNALEHSHWNWERKANYYLPGRGRELLGIQRDANFEGLMLISRGVLSRLLDQQGTPLIYIHYLATAPWNLRGLPAGARYAGVGRLLFLTAINLSSLHGYGGRIGLHSLPQSELFYRNALGMTDCGEDASEDGLRYFELTSTQAHILSNTGGR